MIRFDLTGFQKLTEEERSSFEKIIKEYSKKIEMKLKNISSVAIRLKEYKKAGLRKKTSIHVKIIAPTKIFEAEAHDWDLARTLHKVFNSLEEEIENRFHVSDQHKMFGTVKR